MDNAIGGFSNVAVRQAAIEKADGFDPRLPLAYDLDMWLRILRLRPGNALAIPEVLTFYRRHPVQMTNDWRANRTDCTALLDKFFPTLPMGTPHLRRKADANMLSYLAWLAYERREFASGCRLLGELFRMDPLGYLMHIRNSVLFSMCLAGRVLPAGIQRRLESWARIRTFPH